MTTPRGFVFYRGPSQLDGAPIVAILTGLKTPSSNFKTGALYQTWILREDVNPIDAVRNGTDASICGDCKHRGTNGRKRTCYVRLDTAPNNVYKSYHRGIYPELQLGEARALFKAGKRTRGGSYGDPAAVPYWVWHTLLDLGNVDSDDAGNAYTHQWRDYPELASFCMASVDTEQEYAEAKLLGFRTFRIRGKDQLMLEREFACPASAEMGHKTTCELCQACKGNRSKTKRDVVIVVHGIGKANFQQIGV